METKFEKYKKDERCKKLERSLRLVMLKKGRQSMNENQSNSASLLPSMLSINTDTQDFNHTASSTQSFQTEYEVVSSSNNLQNIMTKKGKTYSLDNKIVTSSSIKQSSTNQNYFVNKTPALLLQDVDISHRQFETNSKILKRNLLNSGDYSLSPIQKNSCSLHTKDKDVSNTVINSKERIAKNNKYDTIDNNGSLKVALSNIKNGHERTFFDWRVMLNDHGSLLIKGKLESGKAIHSKPIVKRLTATTVQSKFNHIYHLDGNIVDNRNELPEYVKGKFYNGFPDDWENVYQLWLLYVSHGSKLSFHWPTKITDSDDDLKSEMTDSTFLCPNEDQKQHSKSLECSNISTAQDITKTMKLTNDLNVKPSLGGVCSNDWKVHISEAKTNNPSNSKPYTSALANTFISTAKTKAHDSNKENRYKDENEQINKILFRKGYTMKDVMQQDTIDIIIKNLLHKDCPKEYILKILQMFDFIDDVLSFKLDTEETDCKSDLNEESLAVVSANDKKGSGLYDENTQGKKTEINLKSSVPDLTNILPMKQYIDHSMRNRDEHKISSRILEKHSENLCNASENKNADESESETYSGVPKIISDFILKDAQKYSFKRVKYKKKRKTIDINPMTRADIKSYKRFKTDQEWMERSYSSDSDSDSKRKTEDQKKGRQENGPKTPVLAPPFKKSPGSVDYDSSVSISEDEELQIKEKLDNTGKGERKETDNLMYNHVFNSSSTDDEIKLTRPKYENTRKIASHGSKEPKIVNYNDYANCTFNALDRNDESNIRSYVDVARYNAFKNTDSINTNKRAVTAKTAFSSKSNNVKKRHYNSKLNDMASINNEQNNRSESSSRVRQTPRGYGCQSELVKTREKDKSTDDKKEMEERDGDNKILSCMKDSATMQVVSSDKCKLLCNWVPRIVSNTNPNSEVDLVFEGKLLNEAGHVIHRKFVTERIHKRISPVVVETTNHELYQLVGDLQDPKHVVPKEVLKYCRKGCPSNISEFCGLWKSLLEGDASKTISKEDDKIATSLINVPTSTRGRKRFPPLRYWTGERVMVKHNQVVYTAGNCTNFANGSPTDNTKNLPILQEGNKHKEHLKTMGTTRTNTANKETPKMLKNRTSAEKMRIEESSKRYENLSDAAEKNTLYHILKQRIEKYAERDTPYDIKCRKSRKCGRDNDTRALLDVHKNKHNTTQESPVKIQNIKYSCYRGIPPADILSDDQISQF